MWLHEVWTRSLNIAGNVWRQIWYPICESKSYLCFQQSYTDVSVGPKRRLSLKNWSFQIVVLEKTLESPLDARRSNQSMLKEINPVYSFEGLMLKIKLQYFSHLMRRASSMEKTLMRERLRARGDRDDRGLDGWMASPTQGTWVWANSGRWWRTGSLTCRRPRVPKEPDTTEQLKKCFSQLVSRGASIF